MRTRKENASKGTRQDEQDIDTASNLNAIKRLIMLLLVKLGTTSDEIATVLQVDASGIRRIVPSRSIKKLELPTREDAD